LGQGEPNIDAALVWLWGNAYVRAMPIETPCTKICTLHPTLRICIGCGRDVGEIARWSQLSASERVSVMGAARQRLALISRTPSA
jgi:predicted Fe-S protein YdhL (DUF1289 family)